MVVVYGYGKDHMVLLTNKLVKKKKEVLSILEAYISRWQIEEMFRIQKTEFQLKNVRVRALRGLNRMHLLLSMMITFMSLKTENNSFFHAVIARAGQSKRKIKLKCFYIAFLLG